MAQQTYCRDERSISVDVTRSALQRAQMLGDKARDGDATTPADSRNEEQHKQE